MESRPGVAVIVVNWNAGVDTLECLESLQRNIYPHDDMIVVDNDSSDGSVPCMKAWAGIKGIRVIEYSRSDAESGGMSLHEEKRSNAPPRRRLIIIHAGDNLGFAGGNNVGIRYALFRESISLIWLLNNDTIVEKNTLEEMIKKLDTEPGAVFCGSVILDYDRPSLIQTVGGGLINLSLGLPRPIMRNTVYDLEVIERKPIRMDFITGCSLLVEKRRLADIGMMDESYFLYWEDTEWSERCRRKGFSLACALRSKVWHKKGNSSVISRKGVFYDSLNGLRFFLRYYPGRLPWIFITRFMAGMLIGFKHADPAYLREFARGYLCFARSLFTRCWRS